MAKRQEVRIVPYEPEYRDVVRDCVYETGDGGESAVSMFRDRELFADFLTLYYTDHEPQSGFIPLVDGEPAGYLLGCTDTERSVEVIKSEIVPVLLKKLVTGGYRLCRGSRIFFGAVLLQQITGGGISPPHSSYPAHLHIDLYKRYRRLGIGRMLIERYLDYLRAEGVPGVHLGTSSYHVQGVPFYEKLGFYRYGVRRLRDPFGRYDRPFQYFDVCYVKGLRNGDTGIAKG